MALKTNKKTIRILFIHGGMTFKRQTDYLKFLQTMDLSFEKKKRWSREYLTEKLGKRFEVLRPDMPLKFYAKYEDWSILFERYLKLLNAPYMLIGHSLGGIFLAKYLSEHKLSKKPMAVYLVASPFDDTLLGEDLAGGFKLKSDLSLLEKNTPRLRLFFSKDDDCVPISHANKFAKKLSQAEIAIYHHRGHFNVPTFPEIIKKIRKDAEAV